MIRATAAAALVLAWSCAAKKPVAPAASSEASRDGKSSYKMIFDPGNPALNLPEDIQFRRPLPEDVRTLPKYPDRALAANDGTHREVVRIVIDTDGKVSQVLDSPLGDSDGGPFAADYRAAVDAAVRTWRFQPGVFQHVKDGEDKDGDGKADYKIMTSWDRVAVYYDLRFTFEIVDGKGTVRRSN